MINCDSTTEFYGVSNAVAQKLHCVVCAGQNIASSDAAFAQNVRADICQYAHEGLNETEITTKIVADYGENINPTNMQSFDMLGLNIALLALMIFGLVIIKRITNNGK